MNSSQVKNKMHEHYQQTSAFHYSLLEAYHILMAIPQQRIALLRRRLRDEEEHHAAILALLIRTRQDRRRPARRWWIKSWIERRQLFGQCYTLFQELERESKGNYMGYIRMRHDIIADLLLRVIPRISKSNRQLYITFDYHYELQLSFQYT